MTGTKDDARPQVGGIAFLVAQVGAYAAQRFAGRVAELGLTPPQVGLMRAIAGDPGSSQQQMAARLGLLPSSMVGLVDELEHAGLVRRERSNVDRRQYALVLTDDGVQMLRRVGRQAAAHEREMAAGLSDEDRTRLGDLLGRLAEHHGLTPGVHPGYRDVGR